MKIQLAVFAIGLTLASNSFALPYVGFQIGTATIAGAKSNVDTGVKRIAIGYEVQRTARLSFVGEIGATDGMTYDAGQLGSYAEDHVQVHIGSSLDALVGAGFRLGRIQWSILGGVQSTKLSTNAMTSQDTLSKMQPLGSVRLQYMINPNVKIGIVINHTFGKSGDVYSFNSVKNAVTLNHVPSITTFMVGVEMAL